MMLASAVLLLLAAVASGAPLTSVTVEKPQGKYCGTVFRGQVGVDVEFVAPWAHGAQSPDTKPGADAFKSKVDVAITVPWLLKAFVSDESCSGVNVYLYVARAQPEKQIVYFTLDHAPCVTEILYKYFTKLALITAVDPAGKSNREVFAHKAASVDSRLPPKYRRGDWDATTKTLDLAGWGSIAPCGDGS